jgi:DNA repair protein RadA
VRLNTGLNNLKDKLRKHTLFHVNDLAFGNTYVISKLLGFNIPETQMLQRAAISRIHSRYNNHSFKTAYDIFQTEIPCRFITGLAVLDELLGGGIETGTITQLYGAPRTCKTQICYTVCTELPADFKVIYIDTEGKFRPERIQSIANSRNLDGEEILKRIVLSSPLDSREQEERIQNSYSLIKKDSKIKFMILDSIMNHYLAEYPGRKYLHERISKLNVQIHILLSIARVNNIAVIITNRARTIMSEDQIGAKELMPYGGSALSSTSTHILHMERSSTRNEFKVSLVKSPICPNTNAPFAITNSGIKDI